MSLTQVFKRTNNTTTTLNGNTAYKNTLSANLDYFAYANMDSALELFQQAYREDKDLALANLLHSRDRKAKGFRDQSKEILAWLANELDSDTFYKLAIKFVEYGRWDDLLACLDTFQCRSIVGIISSQLFRDVEQYHKNQPISLLAKWLPSINAGKASKAQAKKLIALMSDFQLIMTPAIYRKTLSLLRSRLNLVETALSQKCPMNYNCIPSKSLFIYKKALFKRGDFAEWFSARQTIKHSSLQPYELTKDCYNPTNIKMWESMVADWQTADLPSFLVMGDTSFSMCDDLPKINVTALHISISLALFSAWVNPLGVTMTFSEYPEFYVRGNDTLANGWNKLDTNDCSNTNIQLAVSRLLGYCQREQVSQKDMPKYLIIVSDMQFDNGSGHNNFSWDSDIQEQLASLYRQAGYELPRIVYWQINYYSNTPVVKDTPEAIVIGGFSQNLLKQVLANKVENLTPEQYMLGVLEKYRF